VPVCAVIGSDIVTVEASTSDLYRDAGATCTDDVWGDLTDDARIGGFVNLGKIGSYTVTYDVTNPKPWANSAITVKRTVIVRDTTDPVCKIKGDATVSIEASFPYTDGGASCKDSVDGIRPVIKTGSVDIEVEGTYKITYTAKDKSGNDAEQVVRTVKVSDTLKPVIALKYGNDYIHRSKALDRGVNGESNPARTYWPAPVLMAEAAQNNGAMIGAIAAASIAGVALIAMARRSSNDQPASSAEERRRLSV
jgi:hypothetical protein